MQYSEWISGDVAAMVTLPFDQLVDMFKNIPYGTIEPDPEKQAKLSEALLVMCSGAVFSQDFDLHADVSRMGNTIVSILPEDSHAQSFSIGVLSVMVTVANTVDQLRKNGLPNAV
jgi:hypothetical protein